MLKFYRFILLSVLIAPFSQSLADSAGLVLGLDSVEIYYNNATTEKLLKNTRQNYSLMYSQESAPRNLMLSADFELLKYSRPLKKNYIWGPKIGTYLADFNESNLAAVSGGVYFRRPAKENQKFDYLTELLYAPQITSFIKGEYLWSFKFQVNYSLPDNAELNLGYRKMQIKLDGQPVDSFETGVFVGLSARF